MNETEMGLSPNTIIVRMPNWVGDMVMATPILTDLRRAFPKAKITAMCRYPLSELLEEDEDIDELFCFRKVKRIGTNSEKRDIVEKLKIGQYDLGVLLTHSFSSAWWFWKGKIAERLGYDCNGRKFFLTMPAKLPINLRSQHLVLTYKMLLAPLGIPISDSSPRIFLSDKEVEAARKLLRQHGLQENNKLVGINPGATYGSAKCWLPDRFRELTQRLLEDKELFVLYFGDQATASLVKEICHGLSPRAINLAGLTSLRELACLIKLCDVLLTNDSGPMHIAAALGTAVVALFGSTSEIVTGPYRNGRVIHKHVECSPCYQRTCPIDFRCMKQIETVEVFDEISKTLDKKSSKLKVFS